MIRRVLREQRLSSVLFIVQQMGLNYVKGGRKYPFCLFLLCDMEDEDEENDLLEYDEVEVVICHLYNSFLLQSLFFRLFLAFFLSK